MMLFPKFPASPGALAGLSLTLCLTFSLAIVVPADSQTEENFRPLLNGKDLSGWVAVNTAPSTWSFNEEGYLVCSGKPIGEIRTEKMYQNFILELEWRHLKPKGNAGVFIWADDITARGQPFHRGIEVQVLENAYGQSQGHTTHGDIFPIHGATMKPENGRGGGGRAFPTEERSKPSPEWNHYRIECRDGEISLAVNGKIVTRGKECVPRKGYICLESEGGIVHYRNVRIHELPDTPVDPAQVAIANRGYRSLYTGVDLSGWKDAAGWQAKDWVLGSATGAAPLTSAENFSGDLGFVIDFKLTKDSGVPAIAVRGATLKLDAAEPRLGPLLEESGRWNRIEGKLAGDKLSLTVNGKPLENAGDVSGLMESGPVVLTPAGPADWANIYVKTGVR
jgi:hypothetical protein